MDNHIGALWLKGNKYKYIDNVRKVNKRKLGLISRIIFITRPT
jgi:hypothetical protein